MAWTLDKTKPDPYRLPKSSELIYYIVRRCAHTDALLLDVTLDQVRLMMAEEEKKRAEAGDVVLNDVSTGAFLLLGTEIQNPQ